MPSTGPSAAEPSATSPGVARASASVRAPGRRTPARERPRRRPRPPRPPHPPRAPCAARRRGAGAGPRPRPRARGRPRARRRWPAPAGRAGRSSPRAPDSQVHLRASRRAGGQRLVRLAAHRCHGAPEDVGGVAARRGPRTSAARPSPAAAGCRPPSARSTSSRRSTSSASHGCVPGRRPRRPGRPEPAPDSPRAAPRHERTAAAVQDAPHVEVGPLVAHPVPLPREVDERGPQQLLGDGQVPAHEVGGPQERVLAGLNVLDELDVGPGQRHPCPSPATSSWPSSPPPLSQRASPGGRSTTSRSVRRGRREVERPASRYAHNGTPWTRGRPA